MKSIMYIKKQWNGWDDDDADYTITSREPERYEDYITVLVERVDTDKELKDLFGR